MRPGTVLDAQAVLEYLLPLLEPVRAERFRFTREWLRAEALRLGDPRSPAAALGRQLNLPPSYLLIHRVTLGTIGVLCQLAGEAPFREEMARWQPGFAPPGSDAAAQASAAALRRAVPPAGAPAPEQTRRRHAAAGRHAAEPAACLSTADRRRLATSTVRRRPRPVRPLRRAVTTRPRPAGPRSSAGCRACTGRRARCCRAARPAGSTSAAARRRCAPQVAQDVGPSSVPTTRQASSPQRRPQGRQPALAEGVGVAGLDVELDGGADHALP